MGIIKVVTDFDNTITEEKGLETFFETYAHHFCEGLGILKSEYDHIITTVRRDMDAEPLKYGWRHNGFFSAPVTGDPIGSNTVAHIEIMHRMMRGELINITVKNKPVDEAAILELKEQCYLKAYPQRQTFFRDGAAEYLNDLASMFPDSVAITSNSKESSIKKKLEDLTGLKARLSVIGSAQKMVVNSEEGKIQPDGFPVPINPDRREYLSALKNFQPDLKCLAVIGDNFFLDIATVLVHGGYGVLLKTEATQGYEIPFLEKHPRGYFAENYESALQFLNRQR